MAAFPKIELTIARRSQPPRRTSTRKARSRPHKLGQIARQNEPVVASKCASGRPLLTESAPQVEFVLTRSKQTTEKFLTEARTHIRIFDFSPFSTQNLGQLIQRLLIQSRILRRGLPYHSETEMAPVGETDAAVEADSVGVTRTHVQNRNFLAAANPANQLHHQRRRITVASMIRMRAHRADFGVPGDVHSLACHRGKLPFPFDADEIPQLVRARAKWPRLHHRRQRHHLRHIRGRQLHKIERTRRQFAIRVNHFQQSPSFHHTEAAGLDISHIRRRLPEKAPRRFQRARAFPTRRKPRDQVPQIPPADRSPPETSARGRHLLQNAPGSSSTRSRSDCPTHACSCSKFTAARGDQAIRFSRPNSFQLYQFGAAYERCNFCGRSRWRY